MLLVTCLRNNHDRLASQKPVQSYLASTLANSLSNLVEDLERSPSTSSNLSLTQRTVGDEGDLLTLTVRQNLLFNRPIYKTVFYLVRDDLLLRQCSLSFPHLSNREIAHAEIPHHSVLYKLLHRPHRFSNRNARIGPVKLVEVHPFHSQPVNAFPCRSEEFVVRKMRLRDF